MDDKQYERAVSAVLGECRVTHARRLSGGTSTTITLLELVSNSGDTNRFVVREYGETALALDPHIARKEHEIVGLVAASRVPVPRSYGYDESRTTLPMPFGITEFVEGDVATGAIEIDVCQLAAVAADLHMATVQTDIPMKLIDERVYRKLATVPQTMDSTFQESRLRELVSGIWPLEQINQSVLLHGDLWPGNTIWRNKDLKSVIDWEDAALGDPLAEVSNVRLELMWFYGPSAMDDFTSEYKRRNTALNFEQLPQWDLWAALRPVGRLREWGFGEDQISHFARLHEAFVENAINELA